VGLNSDDPSVFNTSLTDEMTLMSEEGGLDYTTLVAMTLNAADSTFLSSEKKMKLREEILARFSTLR
jgi:adenosine deaminase